ncbi:PucR family transcriptional regulator ligand-binding domain-containing protein [Paenibacillus sp. MZ04-78.2]|uniref:PucR family transcriptional regulator n=1 Tax=Paenibacillus sp. MZ04-78.2 TaxID=2962034 RepID=UPI0020B67E93|nr:PucR family transcriptional regulator [Paenibacillus sp. MZ04-78.2]MCP3776032.1 PucR family transcriptional regulator ligand-binding domain-containing protein [Paenibacillus sp. MZ04-78.2]
MGISIQEAIQLPVMSLTKLVAGFDGMNNIIKWVTIVEVIEDIDRLQEGEFLITTGFGLMESEEKRNQFHKLLSNKKLSGVAMYTGFYLREIPQSFIDIANRSALPLLEIPTDINFSVITKAILEQIVNNQFRMFEHSINIHKEFTRLVLENQGIQAITETLSRLTDGSIVLFDADASIVSDRIVHDAVRRTGQDRLLLFSEPLQPPFEQQLLHLTDHESEYTISLYPVMANQTNYGWITAIKEKERWKDIDQIAVEHAATVYAIEFLRHKAILDTEIRFQGEFLDQVLSKNVTNKAEVIERGKKLGFDPSGSQAVLHIKVEKLPPDLERRTLDDMLDRLYLVVNQTMSRHNRQFLLRNRLDGCVVLMETGSKGTAPEAAEEASLLAIRDIADKWSVFYPEYPLRIGIGKSYTDLADLAKSAQEAHRALVFAKLLHKPKSVVHYDDLGLYHFLIQMQELGIDLRQFAEEQLGALMQNKRQGADLLQTLETYLYHNQSLHVTAAELFIHRHTLKYRLNQIEKKTRRNLQSSEDRLKLEIAIMAYKLTVSSEEL